MKNSYFMVGGLLFIPTLPSFFGLCSLPAWSTQYWALTLVCHCVDRAFSEALFSNLSITFYNAFLWVTFLGLLTWNLVAKALLTVAKLFDSPYLKMMNFDSSSHMKGWITSEGKFLLGRWSHPGSGTLKAANLIDNQNLPTFQSRFCCGKTKFLNLFYFNNLFVCDRLFWSPSIMTTITWRGWC